MRLNVSHETSQQIYTPPSSAEDMCLSLLNKQNFTPTFLSADRDRRAAGIVTLGTLLGIRFALEHSGTGGQALTMQDKAVQVLSGRNVDSVAAYRECRKTEAMNAGKEKPDAETGA